MSNCSNKPNASFQSQKNALLEETGLRYFEDFVPGQVIDLGYSEPVGRADITQFAHQHDPQPFHLEEAAAQASLFKGLTASGWQTTLIYIRLCVCNLINKSAALGSNEMGPIKWYRPVRPGDVLRGTFKVVETVELKSRPTVGLVKAQGTLHNQDDELVMVMDGTLLFARRPQL